MKNNLKRKKWRKYVYYWSSKFYKSLSDRWSKAYVFPTWRKKVLSYYQLINIFAIAGKELLVAFISITFLFVSVSYCIIGLYLWYINWLF